MTRDLREGDAKLFDLRFTVIDTAGLEEVTDDSLQGRMRRLTERAVDMADVCLFLLDGRGRGDAQRPGLCRDPAEEGRAGDPGRQQG